MVGRVGFDHYLGYPRAVNYSRNSLNADLMEPFRAPAVDRFTFNHGDFGTGVSFPKWIRIKAERLLETLSRDTTFRPFKME